MIAKLIVWDANRQQAINKLLTALNELHITGVDTNIHLVANILTHADFQSGKINTDFINAHKEQLIPTTHDVSNNIIAVAALIQFLRLQQTGNNLAKTSMDITSPWFIRDGWRLLNQHQIQFKLWSVLQKYNINIKMHLDSAVKPRNDEELVVTKNDFYCITVDDTPIELKLIWQDSPYLAVSINNQQLHVKAIFINSDLHIFYQHQHVVFHTIDPSALSSDSTSGENHLTAPMPGTVVKVFVKAGDKVNKGDKLIILEAMKMEHTVYAPDDGVIKEILFQAGDTLTEGVELLQFE
jgi:3-methylcrotonyl-CoA carboxylase alpha subunit